MGNPPLGLVSSPLGIAFCLPNLRFWCVYDRVKATQRYKSRGVISHPRLPYKVPSFLYIVHTYQ